MHPCFFIRTDKKYIRINYADLLYMESIGNYVKLFTDTGVLLTSLTIKELEKNLPVDSFCRINRGTIVSISRIISFDRDCVVLKNARFSFSDKYRKLLEGKIRIVTHAASSKPALLHIGPEGLQEDIQ